MAENNKPVINFAEEVQKRTGVVLDEPKIRREALGLEPTEPDPTREPASPEDDRIVKLAMEVLELVRQHQLDTNNPLLVLASMQVVGNALAQQYVMNYGREKTIEIVNEANKIAMRYQAGFKHESMDGDQEDKPER